MNVKIATDKKSVQSYRADHLRTGLSKTVLSLVLSASSVFGQPTPKYLVRVTP